MYEEKRERWTICQGELRELLKKEVYLMRELLANMHEEELSLLFHGEDMLKQMLEARSYIVKQLGEVREMRLKKTEEIETMIKEVALDATHLLKDEVSTEIFNLREQLTALTEQMNRQQSANQHLIEHPNALPPKIQGTGKNKKKISITTK